MIIKRHCGRAYTLAAFLELGSGYVQRFRTTDPGEPIEQWGRACPACGSHIVIDIYPDGSIGTDLGRFNGLGALGQVGG